ncbi:MAG: hypothetical protein JWO58_3324 [Chitinophagaceae bacterium]|nr:hypothetical protein [Chitinophagaceae bacterium]
MPKLILSAGFKGGLGPFEGYLISYWPEESGVESMTLENPYPWDIELYLNSVEDSE